MIRRILWAAIASTILFTGCSGGGSTPGGLLQTASSGNSYQLAIAVPKGPLASVRGRNYVSPNTQSVQITVVYSSGPGPSTIANLNASNPNCAPASNPPGTLVCQVTLIVQGGAQSFAVSTYDQPGGAGNVLSTGTIAVPPPSGALTLVHLVLSGVPAALSLAFIGAVPQVGTAGTYQLAVNALDATGAIIVGPGNFSVPLTIQTDTPAHVQVSPSQITAPGTPVTVTYDGAAISSALVRASASNGPAAAVNIFGGSGGGSLPPSGGGGGGSNGPYLYVSDTGSGVILRYSLPLTASSTPVPTVALGSGSNPIGLAFNPALTLVAISQLSGAVSVYNTPLTTASTPVASLSVAPYAGYLTFDPLGNLWVTNQLYDVFEFTTPFATGHTYAKDLAIFSGTFGVAFDSQLNMYVSNADNSGILDAVPSPYSSSSYQYAIYPTAPNVSLLGTTVINSQVWVADAQGGNISAYTTPVTTTSTPAITVHIANAHPHAIVYDYVNNKMYVSDATTTAPKILVFNMPVTSTSTPVATLTTGFSRPNGMDIGP